MGEVAFTHPVGGHPMRRDSYQRREPEQTALYQTIAAHWPEFLERAEELGGLPRFVVKEFDEFLKCGILECRDCGNSLLAATIPADAERGVIQSPPFRAPHHSVSEAGLVGGGDPLRPGEVGLAHHGVLFLDELAEFRRSVLESLCQPLEDGVVHVARARARAWFPARSLLVAATNPCPCGSRSG